MSLKKTDYQTMINFGSWLQDFLKLDKPSFYALKGMVDRGLSLLEIDVRCNDDDLPLIFLSNTLPVSDKTDLFSIKLKALSAVQLRNKSVKDGMDPVNNGNVTDFIDGEDDNIYEFDSSAPENVKVCDEGLVVDYINDAVLSISNIQALLLFIDISKCGFKELVFDGKREYSADGWKKLNSLVPMYNRITDKLVLDDSTIRTTKTIELGSTHWFVDVSAIVSRIFIDFMLLGGDRYFGFCQQCNSFFFSERKGRKQYCSDHCRVKFHRS